MSTNQLGGRLIGVDHGLARLGLALSDPSGLVARELRILERRSKREDFALLNAIARQHEAVAFVVGIPYSDAPPETYTQADRVRTWMTRFAELAVVPLIEWDEQLSSDDARELARQQRRPPDAPIDDLAARVILQSYLNALHDGLAPLPPRP